MTGPPQVSAWNIANYLTVLRLLLVPVFLVLLLAREGEDDVLRLAAAGRVPARRPSPTGWTARSPAAGGWSPPSARWSTRSPTRR
jgi:phosphatidylglycerophosphate synthase